MVRKGGCRGEVVKWCEGNGDENMIWGVEGERKNNNLVIPKPLGTLPAVFCSRSFRHSVHIVPDSLRLAILYTYNKVMRGFRYYKLSNVMHVYASDPSKYYRARVEV